MNRTVERTMAILRLISENSRGITLQEIATDMDMAKSSASVIVHTLLELGFIKSKEDNSRKYVLGVETFALGMKYLDEVSLVSICANFLPGLAERHNRTAFVGVLSGTNVVYLYKYVSSHARLATCAIGSSRAAYATALGKALIAFLPEKDRQRIISEIDFKAFTRFTIADRESFTREMDITRTRGYARERGELEDLTLCFAAPVFDYSGKVVAAISLSDIYSPGGELDEPSITADLMEVSGAISRNLGYTGDK